MHQGTFFLAKYILFPIFSNLDFAVNLLRILPWNSYTDFRDTEFECFQKIFKEIWIIIIKLFLLTGTRKLIPQNSGSQKLLGLTIDIKLNFNEQVINLYDKARVTIQALERIFPYIPQTQKRLLMNVYLV